MEILKKILALLLVLTLLWLLFVLYGQLGGRAVAGIFCLLVLLKFALENNDGFFKKGIIKIPALLLIVTASLILPNYASREDKQHQSRIDNLWQKFDESRINNLVGSGKVVVVDITADWCITCKFNKLMVLDRTRTIRLLDNNNIIAMRGDLTGHDRDIRHYLAKNNSYGVPFNKVYGSSAPEGIILPVIISYDELKAAIEKSR